jgi:hypothetical protein
MGGSDGLSLSEAWHGLDSVGTRVCDTPQLVCPSRIFLRRKPPALPLPPPQASSSTHCASSKNISDRHPSPTMMMTRFADAPAGGSTGSRPVLAPASPQSQVWFVCGARPTGQISDSERKPCCPTSGGYVGSDFSDVRAPECAMDPGASVRGLGRRRANCTCLAQGEERGRLTIHDGRAKVNVKDRRKGAQVAYHRHRSDSLYTPEEIRPCPSRGRGSPRGCHIAPRLIFSRFVAHASLRERLITGNGK